MGDVRSFNGSMVIKDSTFWSFVGFLVGGYSGKWCAPLVPPEPELPPLEPLPVKGELVTPEPEELDKLGLTVAFISGLLLAPVVEIAFYLVLALRIWARNLIGPRPQRTRLARYAHEQ